MKNIISILFLSLFLCSMESFADDCTDGLTEAKEHYNNGNFQTAKELFEYVKSECPQNYAEASNWIAKCNDALTPQTSKNKQSTSKTSSSKASYLKVNGYTSNSTVYLLNSNSSKTITISCSTSYSIYNIPSWCSITNRTSTSFTLNYQANPNTYTRYGSIDISGGGTSIRLSLEQAAKTTTSYLIVNGNTSNSTVYLMSSSSSKTITVNCSTSYSIYNIPSWCSIANRTSTSFTLNYQANPNTYTRYGSIDISGGGTNIRLSLEQVAKPSTTSNSSSKTSSSNSSSLKVNKSLIVATAIGVTDYITVTCNKPWEIQYPNGGMYTATRSGNKVKVVISANSTASQRTDFFNIRTTDGKETIKISLSQSGKSSTSSYSSYNSGQSSYNRNRLSAYQRYKQSCGDFEVTWGGLNTSFGTAWEVGFSALRLRWGWFQLCPIEGVIGVNLCDEDGDWVGFDEGTDIFAYQPTINFVIPTDDYQAIYFGAGPSVTFDGVWFKIEAGYRLHWGDWASSDIFMRYDGTFTVGASIQWSSYY